MPKKKGKPRPKRYTHQQGGDFKSFIRGAKKVLGKINDGLKKTKIISTVANFIPHPAAKAVGTVAGRLGYGKQKRKRRRHAKK